MLIKDIVELDFQEASNVAALCTALQNMPQLTELEMSGMYCMSLSGHLNVCSLIEVLLEKNHFFFVIAVYFSL
jgi:hypothetical protein